MFEPPTPRNSLLRDRRTVPAGLRGKVASPVRQEVATDDPDSDHGARRCAPSMLGAAGSGGPRNRVATPYRSAAGPPGVQGRDNGSPSSRSSSTTRHAGEFAPAGMHAGPHRSPDASTISTPEAASSSTAAARAAGQRRPAVPAPPQAPPRSGVARCEPVARPPRHRPSRHRPTWRPNRFPGTRPAVPARVPGDRYGTACPTPSSGDPVSLRAPRARCEAPGRRG